MSYMYNLDYISDVINDLDSCANKRCISCSRFNSGDDRCAYHLICAVLPIMIELKEIKASKDSLDECLSMIAKNISLSDDSCSDDEGCIW